MKRKQKLIAIAAFLLFSMGAMAQQPSAAPESGGAAYAPPHHLATVRGCLRGERGNYILIEDNTSMVYVLKGVGNKLDRYLQHDVEVKGRTLPGTIKTGVRSEKAGSNPSDTVHGIDGVPLQVTNLQTDIRMISKHCKAADAE
ncbi:MAG: hypothetical protein WAL32_08195 [Terriglobales bacterium]